MLFTVSRPSLNFEVQADWSAGLTFVSVGPSYQRRELGPRLLQLFCEETDKHERFALVMAAPEGVSVYRRFGFEVVGVVPTPDGAMSSMFRQPHGVPKTIEVFGRDVA